MRAILLLALLAAGCGSSPTAPAAAAPPPAPPPIVVLVASGDLVLGDDSGNGWPITGTFRNTGDGCARSIAGELRILSSGAVVATLPWTLDATFVLRPQQQATYSTCCFKPPPPVRTDYDYRVAFTFQTIAC